MPSPPDTLPTVIPPAADFDRQQESGARSPIAAQSGIAPKSGLPLSQAPLAIIKRLGPAAVMGVMALVLPALGGFVLLYFINDVGPWLREARPNSIAAYVLAFAFFSGFALLPTYAQAIMGGWAFGFAAGFPAAQAGLVAGAIIGYAIARPTASKRVLAIIKEHPRWEAVRVALVGCGYARTLFIITLLRMPPSSPFAMTNLILAGVKVPLSAYALGTFLGMLPRTAMTVFWASQIQNMIASDAAREAVPWWLVGAGITLSLAVLAVIGLMAKKALDRFTAGAPVCPPVEGLSKSVP